LVILFSELLKSSGVTNREGSVCQDTIWDYSL